MWNRRVTILLASVLFASLHGPTPAQGEPPANLPAGAVLRLGVGGGPANAVLAVAFAPDGKTLALTGIGKVIHIHAVTTGKEIRRLEGPQDAVGALAFSDDGKLLAAGGKDGVVHIWDVERGQEQCRLAGHRGGVHAVAFAPEGKRIATAGRDGVVRISDSTKGAELFKLTAHQGEVRTVTSSADGRWLASAGRDRIVRLWDSAAGKEVRSLRGHLGWIYSVTFSADGKTLASAGRDQVIRIWEMKTGKPLVQLAGYQSELYSVAFAADGRTIASAGKDGIVRLWEVSTDQERRRFSGHTAAVRRLAFAPDGKTVASASDDGTVLLWDVTGRRRQGDPLPRDRRSLWSDLASDDAIRAYQAIWDLSAQPAETVTLLKEKLRPLPAEAIDQLIADLDDSRFAVRERAGDELGKLGSHAAPALRKVLKSRPSLEVRRRAEQILAKLDQNKIPPDLLRILRAVEVLEWIGTAEAREVLRTLEKQSTEAEVGRQVKAALARLSAKSK